MKYGIMMPLTGPSDGIELVGRLAQAAEAAGFDSVWLGDHVILPVRVESKYPFNRSGIFPMDPTADMLEPIATMSYLMGQTERVRFGFNVLIVPYRHPVVTAKMLATMDRLSGGRLNVGIGVGWMAEEFAVVDAPAFADRGRATDEYLEVFKRLWTEERPGFQGQFVRFEPVHFYPKPVQQPHPPIFVGGHNAPALRRAGRIGAGWNAFRLAPDVLAGYREQIAVAARAAGRDPSQIAINVSQALNLQDEAVSDPKRPALTGSAQQIRDDVRRYADAGVEELTLLLRPDTTERMISVLDRFASQVVQR